MLNNTKKIKELYEEIQRMIFYAVPGKWDELYLYASIIERLGKVETGEMYFYFMPKGLLKRKFINVYEVPNKYDIEEEEYLKLVEWLYDKIKELRQEFINTNQHVWSNLTISIKNNKFKIEYNYDKLLGSKDEYYNHHIYWRYKYLGIEPHSKKERQAIDEYLKNNTVEGVYTLKSLYGLIKVRRVKMPFLDLIYNMVFGYKKVDDLIPFLKDKE